MEHNEVILFEHRRHGVGERINAASDRLLRAQVGLEARWRALMSQPEEGAATAEYAVVLVAATGFAAVLVALMISDTVKTLLTNIVKKALNV